MTHICTTAPHLLSWHRLLSTWPLPTPATYQPLSLVYAPRSTCQRLPQFPMYGCPAFSYLNLQPGPCWPLGGSPFVGPSVSVFLRFSLPMCLPVSRHLLLFAFCWVNVFVQGREARTPPLPGSCSPRSSPPLLLGYGGAIQGTRLPHPIPYPYHPCCIDPILLVKFHWE